MTYTLSEAQLLALLDSVVQLALNNLEIPVGTALTEWAELLAVHEIMDRLDALCGMAREAAA